MSFTLVETQPLSWTEPSVQSFARGAGLAKVPLQVSCQEIQGWGQSISHT